MEAEEENGCVEGGKVGLGRMTFGGHLVNLIGPVDQLEELCHLY